MAVSQSLEEAVRSYLLAIKNPAALRDEGQLTELESALATEDDPLERVRLRAKLSRARAITPEDFEPGFVDAAAAWADANGVSTDAFVAEGVAEDVLVRAGLLAAPASRARARRPAGRTRVPAGQVRDEIRGQADAFTTGDIVALTGASVATVRKIIGELLEERILVEEGPDPAHEGRGRAPTLYAVKGSRQ